MSRNSQTMEDLALAKIRKIEQQLLKREKESTEKKKRIAREERERHTTMPPLEEIQVRARRLRHEQSLSRGEIANIQRSQNRSLLLLLLLIIATCTLIWWGIKLMQAG
jgi:hypothetical protein